MSGSQTWIKNKKKKKKEGKDSIEREGGTIEGTMKIVDVKTIDVRSFISWCKSLFTYVHLYRYRGNRYDNAKGKLGGEGTFFISRNGLDDLPIFVNPDTDILKRRSASNLWARYTKYDSRTTRRLIEFSPKKRENLIIKYPGNYQERGVRISLKIISYHCSHWKFSPAEPDSEPPPRA